jgi:hypothetical protein
LRDVTSVLNVKLKATQMHVPHTAWVRMLEEPDADHLSVGVTIDLERGRHIVTTDRSQVRGA